MSRRYLVLFGVALAAAIVLSGLGHRAPRAAKPAEQAAPLPFATLVIDVRGAAVTPENTAVPKDHRVRLTVVSHDRGLVSLTLAGYDDRVRMDSLAAGESRSLEFVSDRPGEDFTWLVNGKPSGRLAVTGSHLFGDHR